MRNRGTAAFTVAAVAAAAAVVAMSGGGHSTVATVIRPPANDVGLQVASADAPQSASIVIPKDGMHKGYATKQVDLAQGGSLSVVNFDSEEHTVTSDGRDANGYPLFNVIVEPGQTASIPAAGKLAAGSYAFHCSFHPNMRGTLVISGGSGGVHPAPQSFDQPLVLPRELTGARLRIPVYEKRVRVLPRGPRTRMWTFGGSYPGPTIERPAGHDTRVTFVNHLPKYVGSISVHLHGDHHAARYDGQPTRYLIAHGQQRTYDYPLTQQGRPEPAAFDYYHDHRMDWTTRNNWNGLQGMFVVRDPRQRRLDLPSGRYDVPLMVSEASFDKHNQLTEPFPKHPPMMGMTGPTAPPDDATVGTHILVDGRYAPYLPVTAHRYRLRLLNSSPYTSYDFELSDGRPFVQIGTGDALLPRPVVRQDILLGPSQRADVIVDFHGSVGRNVVLESVPRVSGPPGGIGTGVAELMQFRVKSGGGPDRTRLPDRLPSPPRLHIPRRISAHWTIGLGGNSRTGGSYWTLNGRPFNPHRIDLEVPLGSTQTWVLHNASPMTHYLHLHEELWHTVSRDGQRPPPWERGLEDTWRLDPGETVVVAAKFPDYPGVFMVHCHMLDHEDHGLMAQFAVVPRHHKRGWLHGFWYSGLAAGPPR